MMMIDNDDSLIDNDDSMLDSVDSLLDNDDSLLDSVDFVHTLRQQHASSLPHNRLIQMSSAT